MAGTVGLDAVALQRRKQAAAALAWVPRRTDREMREQRTHRPVFNRVVGFVGKTFEAGDTLAHGSALGNTSPKG